MKGRGKKDDDDDASMKWKNHKSYYYTLRFEVKRVEWKT